MPLSNYITRADYSKQLKQYSGTSAIFSGTTNILQAFYVKSIEIDTLGALDGNALLYDSVNNKFLPGVIGAFGLGILEGLQLTYNSGLTYDVSSGKYRIGATVYDYSGGSVTIVSGQSGGSRLDIVYITTAVTAFVRSGVTSSNPSVPSLSGGELEIGIILIPINFTGGTGSTIIQTTAATTFEFYPTGTGIQRSPSTTNAEASGAFSFALAENSKAYGQNSSALGHWSKASGYSQTVVGPYNDPNIDDYFIVGNGVADNSRSNAFRITTGGSAYIQNKLFVTNVEIETTGATDGQVLKFDGTKFKPQLETITGLTFLTGGTNFISSITNNSLYVKALTGSAGITISDTGELITIGVDLSVTSGVTEITSLTGGTSIISGKTGTTYFLYPIQGSGGTSVGLTDEKVTIYSDPISLINGQNIGSGVEVFATKVANDLQFRRISSVTPSTLSIYQSGGLGETLLISAATQVQTAVTLFEDITYTNLIDKVTASTLDIGKQYRITSGRTNEGVGTFGRVIITAIDTNKLSKNGTLITLNPDYYGFGNYNDVSSFLTNAGIGYSGLSLLTNQVVIFNNNHYKVTANTTFNNTLTATTLLSRNFSLNYGYVLTSDYIEYELTSDTITKRIDSYGNTVEGKSAIDVFQWGRFVEVSNNKVLNNSYVENMNFRGVISSNTFDNNTRILSSINDDNFKLINTSIRNNVLISGSTFNNIQFIDCDISTDFGLLNRTLNNNIFVGKLISPDVNQLETTINVPNATLDLTNFNHFGIFNISAATSSFTINSITNYNQTYKITFKPLPGYQVNFGHTATLKNELADIHPLFGDFEELITYQKRSKTGTTFYQDNINTFKPYTGSSETAITFLTSYSDPTSATSAYFNEIPGGLINYRSGTTVQLKNLSEGLNVAFDTTTEPGYVIINAFGTSINDIQSAGTGDYSIISSVTNQILVYRTLSAGTNMSITESVNGTLIFSSTATGGTSGGSISGIYVSGITSAGTGNIHILSSVTTANTLVYKTISAGTGININEDINDGTLTFISSNFEYMDLATAQAGGPFTIGQWYRIPVSSRTVSQGSNPNTYGDVMVLAVETGKTSPDGYLLAINADYQNVGDYNDVANYNQNHGVPYDGLVVGDNILTQTDIVIWDNQHYAAINNQYTLTLPTVITTNLTLLTKDYTTRNGYIIEPQKIIYNLSGDTIKRMEDNRGNVVNLTSIEHFKFGDDLVYNNTVLTPQGFPISNFPITNIQNNIINQGTIYDLNLSNRLASQNIDLDIINCSINDVNFANVYNLDLKLSGCAIQDGKINKIGTNNITITSQTLTLDNPSSSAIYEYVINATGGTFNGIITAITQTNALVFTTKHRIYNNLTTGTITFKNSTDLKTEGGLDVVLNRYDNVEFSYSPINSSILYQTDINNYI